MPDSSTEFMDQLNAMGGGEVTPERTEADEGKIQYTSHPIKNYRVGRFEFENALLTLKDGEEHDEFLKIIESPKFPERERALIRKLDMSAAERISREYRRAAGGATKQFDSSTGERADSSPKLGVGDLLSTHKRPAELGLEAAAEGGREMNVPGAPDSNRETQTEPSPQMPPEAPFRAEERGAGGNASAEQIKEEIREDAGGAGEKAEAAVDSLRAGRPADVEEAPAVESDKVTAEGAIETSKPVETPTGEATGEKDDKPHSDLPIRTSPPGFGKPLLSGTPKS